MAMANSSRYKLILGWGLDLVVLDMPYLYSFNPTLPTMINIYMLLVLKCTYACAVVRVQKVGRFCFDLTSWKFDSRQIPLFPEDLVFLPLQNLSMLVSYINRINIAPKKNISRQLFISMAYIIPGATLHIQICIWMETFLRSWICWRISNFHYHVISLIHIILAITWCLLWKTH